MKKKMFAFLLAVWMAAGLLPMRAQGTSLVTVYFQVIGGSWGDGGVIQSRSFEPGHVLTVEDVPFDMSPNKGYGGGKWDAEPVGRTVLEDGTTFRFSYQWLITMTFDANGGQWGEDEVQATVKTFLGEPCGDWPEEPTREGFQFRGWWESPEGYGGNFDEENPIVEDMILYARWKENCWLSFDLNGGEGTLPALELPGGLIREDLPEPPPREGYEFHHWNTAPDGSGTVLTPEMELKENTTAYAQWRRIFILHFDGNSEVSGDTLEYTAEESGILSHDFTLPDLSREGHTLLGWNTLPDGAGESAAIGSPYTVDESNNPATLYAIWQRNTCQVTFDGTDTVRDCLWNDTLPDSAFPALPLDEQGCQSFENGLYRFDGWRTAQGVPFTADTPVTESVTVYPCWIPQVEVRFQIQGGAWESGGDTYSVTLDEGAPLEEHLPVPVPDETHKATGNWSPRPGNAADGAVFTFTCDEKKQLQITFDTEDPPMDVLEGDPCPELPAPSRTGFRFDGWYTGKNSGKKFDESLPISKNISLYARWVQIFTLTYDANGGEDPPPPEVVEAGGDTNTFTLSQQSPTRKGYSFQGWADSADAALPQLHGGDPCRALSDVTLYAVWKKDLVLVTVTFVDRDTETARVTLMAGECPCGAMAETPVRQGYSFLGWNTARDGSGQPVTAETVISENTTAYACWEKKPQATLTFMDRGREVDWFTLETGGCMGANMPAEPTRKGYQFLGWQEADGEGLADTTPVQENLTVYAVWEKITRGTVTFLDGDRELHKITLDLGAKLGDNLPPEPTRSGHRFLGWNTREDGTGSRLYRSTVLREDLTAWAQWEEIEYVTLTFHDRFGTSPTVTLEQNTKAGDQFPANPIHSGYTFRGWYTEENGAGQKVTKSTKIQEDTDVYACWKRKNITNAQTGDNSHICLWTGVLAVSALGLAAVFMKKRRK